MMSKVSGSGVMGIDLGIRKIAWSMWEGDKLIKTEAYESKATHRAIQLNQLAIYIFRSVNTYRPKHVFIEDTLIGNNKNYSIKLSQTMGAILAELGEMTRYADMGIYQVDNKHWKKEVVGNGNAQKNTIRNYIDQKDPAYPALCGDDQDRYDAACIGLYGVIVAERAGDIVAKV